MYWFINFREKLFLACRITCQFDTGILPYMQEEGICDMNFLDAMDARFHDFKKILGACMKEPSPQGIGLSSKQNR